MTDDEKAKKKQTEELPVVYFVPQWSAWTRRIVSIFILLAGLYSLTFLGSVIHILIVAMILVFILFTPARALTRRLGIPYPLSVFIIYCIFGLSLFYAIFSFIPTVLNWAVDFTNSAINVYSQVQDDLQDYTYEDGIINIFNFDIDFNFVLEPIKKVMLGEDIIPEDAETLSRNVINAEEIDLQAILNQTLNLVGTVTGALTNVANIVLQFLFVFILSFLILLDIPRFYKSFFSSISPVYRREYGLLSMRILKVWNNFFKGEATLAFVIGILTWIQLELMGIPGAEVLGIFTGLISLIPSVGGLIALIPLAIVPLLQGSTVLLDLSPLVLTGSVMIANLVIQQIIWNVFAPKILGEAVSVPLPFIIVGLFVGASVGGVLGAFLISPILGSIKVFIIYMLHKLSSEDPFPNQEDPRLAERSLFER